MSADLSRLLAPKSIAVIGGREAAEVIHQCDRMAFEGPVWPVNPNRDSIAGRTCVARVEELPAPPDAVFIAVPAEPTIDNVGRLAAMGAGGAVCYASGFKEVGEAGAERQRRLVEAAGDMPIIGPNCYGVLNYTVGAALWPDQHGGERVERGVAIVTQSGNMGLNFTMQRRGLPLAALVAVGNQAQTGIEICVEALLDDDRIDAIGLHIEGLSDLPRFVAAAAKALRKGVPIVALKTGRSQAGAKIAMSHTASLAGADGLYDALFERLGVARAASVDTFMESLKFLAVAGPLGGGRIASMSCSGGEASLMADLAEGGGLEFPEMAEAHRADVAATLNEYVSVSNPLDYHTFIWGDEDQMTDTFTAMMRGGYDATLLVLDYPREDRCRLGDWWRASNALVAAQRATGGRAAVLASLQECLPEETAKSLAQQGVAPMLGMEQTLQALEGARVVGRARAAAPTLPALDSGLVEGEPATLDEWRAKRLLAAAGLSVPDAALVGSAGEALAAAEALGYPVCVKAVSADIVHKTEAGAVALELHDAEAVHAAAERMFELSDRVMVERMVADAVAELIVGVDRDPQFGPYLVVGFGGVMVELIGDSRIILPPAGRDEVRAALLGLKTAPLLQGYRGRPPGDVEAAVDAVLAVAAFVEENARRVVEIDVNPLMVRPEGQGAVAADAYVRMIEED